MISPNIAFFFSLSLLLSVCQCVCVFVCKKYMTLCTMQWPIQFSNNTNDTVLLVIIQEPGLEHPQQLLLVLLASRIFCVIFFRGLRATVINWPSAATVGGNLQTVDARARRVIVIVNSCNMLHRSALKPVSCSYYILSVFQC